MVSQVVREITYSALSAKQNKELNDEERLDGKEILESKPVVVLLPTGTRCNVRCVFCAQREEAHCQDLSFTSFLNYANSLKYANPSSLALYGWSEPLINPEYELIFDHVGKQFSGIEIHVSTNGTLMNRTWAQKFVAYENAIVNISINAARRETYYLVTGHDSFDQVITNVSYLSKCKQGSKPIISLSFVVIKQNVQEIPEFVELAAELGAQLVVLQDLIILESRHRALALSPQGHRLAECVVLEAIEKALRNRIVLMPHVSTPYFPSQSDGICTAPWDTFRVGINGDVAACCYSRLVMGNVFEQSLSQIWNGEVYRHLKKTVNGSAPPPDCKRCGKKINSGDPDVPYYKAKLREMFQLAELRDCLRVTPIYAP